MVIIPAKPLPDMLPHFAQHLINHPGLNKTTLGENYRLHYRPQNADTPTHLTIYVLEPEDIPGMLRRLASALEDVTGEKVTHGNQSG